jgi:hypothetical protein
MPWAQLAQQLTRLATGDSSLAPSRFSGSKKDIDNVDTWLRYFNHYVTFRNMSELDALNLFRLLMTDLAAEWMSTQPPAILDDYTSLMRAFKDRFTLNAMQRVQKAVDVWHRVQQPNETVDAYIADIRKFARQGGLKEEAQIATAIIRGLKLNIRLHVLTHSNSTTLNDVIDAARTAEAALALAPDSTDQTITELSKTVALLADKLAAKDTGATTTTTPAPVMTTTPNISVMAADRYQDGYPQQQQRFQHQRQFNNNRFGRGPRGRGTYQPTRGSRQQRSFADQQQRTDAERSCGNCGRQHSIGNCAARGNQCYACSKYGHFARCCRSAQPRSSQ